VARALVVNEVCRELAEVAADLNVPAILLKGAALQLGGWTEPGSRSMGDVDVLIPTDSANTYEEALIDLGCRSPKAPVSEHQLQLLAHPTGLGLEVHTRVRGVRMTGGRSATAEDLLERELCHPLEGLARGCSIPSRMVLIAHALVHGIAQHGLAPDSYPWSRFLADLQDLKVDRASWPETAAAVLPWLQRDVSADEMTAAVELVDRLACGEDAQAIVACEGRPAVLLQHLVGGVDDDEYVRLMRLERRSSGLSDHPRWMRIARSVKRNLWLSRAGVERRYGQPKNELGYLVRRLWRPLDLASETIGDGWAWMRHRLRRR
jgi:hypothetical protein